MSQNTSLNRNYLSVKKKSRSHFCKKYNYLTVIFKPLKECKTDFENPELIKLKGTISGEKKLKENVDLAVTELTALLKSLEVRPF